MRRLFYLGGYVASVVLIVAGAATIAVGALGFLEVRDTIAQEKITATDDARDLGVDLDPGEPIDTGAEAKAFAQIIRTHALEATEGKTYAEMGRYLTPSGEETNDEGEAATDESGQPVQNQARNLWVTATSLTTALNTAFLAERVSLFSILMGFVLVVVGIGFLGLTIFVLRSSPVDTSPAEESA
jgi:hypothetical protein